ncbi:hypothetical protein CEXT_295431, partial [Caerostris extrusa]
ARFASVNVNNQGPRRNIIDDLESQLTQQLRVFFVFEVTFAGEIEGVIAVAVQQLLPRESAFNVALFFLIQMSRTAQKIRPLHRIPTASRSKFWNADSL